MSDMMHWIRIDAPADAVYRALTTQEGLKGWWTADVEAKPREGSTSLFGFNNRAVVFRMRIDELAPGERVRWTCLGDFDEWEGTSLEFRLRSDDGGGTEVFFTHGGWASTGGYFRQCNTDWGRLMYYLKDHVEGRDGGPMMS